MHRPFRPLIIAIALATAQLSLFTAPPASAAPCDVDYNAFNGPQSLFLNLHNCGTACAVAELPYLALIRDGLSGVRIAPVVRDLSQPGTDAFFEVNPSDPYLEGALDLFGPDSVLVLLDDSVDRGPRAKPTPEQMLRKLESLLATHPSVRKIEFMNEPSNFSGIEPVEYVARYLRPARRIIDAHNRSRPAGAKIRVYSAAWFGNLDGVRETQRMVRAGALGLVDALSAHIYAAGEEEAAAIAAEYRRVARGTPVAVTETNFNRSNRSDYSTQGWWVCRSMTAMERVLRRGLGGGGEALQVNVLYTLRADSERHFNLLSFPDSSRPTFWQPTGVGHALLSARSDVPTDPKAGGGSTGGSGTALGSGTTGGFSTPLGGPASHR